MNHSCHLPPPVGENVSPRRGRATRRLGVLVACGVVAAAAWAVPGGGDVAEAASAKITICHRTHSTTNPYRRITVAQNAVQNGRHGGHTLPNGSSNPPVYDSTFTYVSNNKYWGDIIPGGDAAGLPYNGSNPVALNWTTPGKAVFFGSLCGAMTPTEFYDAEVAAGQLPAAILADLNAQSANEDAALLAAIGGTFTAGNITTWATAVSVTTLEATTITETTATLNGTLTVGSTSTITSFHYGTSPTLATRSTAAATPSPVTNTTAVTTALDGLTPGTTYFYRAVGTTNAGSDTEGILLGEILSFQTLPVEEVTTTEAATTTTQAATTTTAAATTTEAATTTTAAATTTTQAATTTEAATTTTEAATTTTEAATTTTEAATTTTAAETTTTAAATTTTEAATTTQAATTTTAAATTTTQAATTTTEPATATTAGVATTSTVAGPTSTDAGPTTTVPEPSTSPSVDAVLASVHGIVWFDRNHDGVFNGTEWVLPGVTVTLSASRPPQGNGLLRTATATDPATGVTAVTAIDGSYQFNGLVPGPYTVTAHAAIKGFDYTSDTDGSADWIVGVEAIANTSAVADFAGLGRGEVVGQVFETTSMVGLPFAAITCTWSGFDDLAGTGDDVTFQVSADATGSFDMAGVPYGYFTCDGQDASTGRSSAAAAATVFSPEPVQAPLPIEPVAPPRIVAETPPGGLPETGSDSTTALRLAFGLTFAGLLVVIGMRRRPRPTRPTCPTR